jgi:hypothetical protein
MLTLDISWIRLGKASGCVPRVSNIFKVVDLSAHPAAAMLGAGDKSKYGG